MHLAAVCGLEWIRVADNGPRPLGARSQRHMHRKAEMRLYRRFDPFTVSHMRPEHHIPALDVGLHALVAQLGEHVCQRGHANLAVPTDVDAAQQGDVPQMKGDGCSHARIVPRHAAYRELASGEPAPKLSD